MLVTPSVPNIPIPIAIAISISITPITLATTTITHPGSIVHQTSTHAPPKENTIPESRSMSLTVSSCALPKALPLSVIPWAYRWESRQAQRDRHDSRRYLPLWFPPVS
jgi:hypothetical protein